MITKTILILATLLQGSMALAATRSPASQNPTAAERRICFRYLRSQSLAPAGWQSSNPYAFSHTTVRASTQESEYVWQIEIVKDDGSDEAFVYVTTNAACTAVESISAPSYQ